MFPKFIRGNQVTYYKDSEFSFYPPNDSCLSEFILNHCAIDYIQMDDNSREKIVDLIHRLIERRAREGREGHRSGYGLLRDVVGFSKCKRGDCSFESGWVVVCFVCEEEGSYELPELLPI